MDQRANPVGLLMRRLPRTALTILKTPWIWAGLLFAGSAVQFSYHPWAVGQTTDLLSLANSLDFKGIVIDGFTEAVRYRPLLHVAVDLLYGIVGANLTVFKAVTIVQFAGILWCLVALCRVSTAYQALAACLALSCFVGLHTSRILLGFFPLNHHSLVLLSLLAIAVLGMRPHRSLDSGLLLCRVPRPSPCYRDGAAAASDAGGPVVGRRTRRAAPRRRLGSGRRDALRGRAHDVQLGWRRHSMDSRRVWTGLRADRAGRVFRRVRRGAVSVLGYTTSWRVS